LAEAGDADQDFARAGFGRLTSSIMSGLLTSYQSAHARDMAFPTVIDTIPLRLPRRNLQLDQSAPVRINGLAAYDAKLVR
jgi:hypothetical protein